MNVTTILAATPAAVAALGLLFLLAGAVTTHLRNRDGLKAVPPHLTSCNEERPLTA